MSEIEEIFDNLNIENYTGQANNLTGISLADNYFKGGNKNIIVALSHLDKYNEAPNYLLSLKYDEHFFIYNKVGEKEVGRPGDFLVEGKDGKLAIMDKEEFKENYSCELVNREKVKKHFEKKANRFVM